MSIGSSANDWNTKPSSRAAQLDQLALAGAGQLALAEPDPAARSARSSPPSMLSRVVLPEPDGPRSTTSSPACSSTDASATAWTAVSPLP